jgi:phosphohistidine phosphatase SixA
MPTNRSAFVAAMSVLLLSGAAHAQTLSGEALVKALRQGGYVIVMRHASSPRDAADKKKKTPKSERQLDEKGRATATAMGKMLRDLKIPIGEVYTSPSKRAVETVQLAQWPNPKLTPELGDNGKSMSGGTQAQAEWLQKKVTQLPSGTNTILVTHLPNITRAFPGQTPALADGEAMIFGADGKGGFKTVARVKIEDWPKMKG